MSEAGPELAPRYLMIVPVRDEEEYLEESLRCFTEQTVPPAELIVVDDGSSDRTGEIAEEFVSRYPWVHVVHREDRGSRSVGAGVIEAFYAGYEARRIDDYAYICKVDGDLSLGADYFEEMLKKFAANPRLGGASGKVWHPVGEKVVEERISDESVIGAVNFWRRECWEAIGGFVREVMWDGITWHRCRMLGWETRSFRDERLEITHHRLMGSSQKSIAHGRLRWGHGQWFMGTHPLYILASGVYRMFERPYVVGGLLIIAGYLKAWLKGVPRYGDDEFRRSLHRWQLGKLRLGWLVRRASGA